MSTKSKHWNWRRVSIALGLGFALVLGLGFALVLGLCGWLLVPASVPAKAPEPVYKGGTLSQWCQTYWAHERSLRLHHLLVGQSGSYEQGEMDAGDFLTAKRDEAAAAIRAMGTNAVPALMDMLRYEDSIRTRTADFLDGRTPLLHWMTGEQKHRYLPTPGVADEKHNNGFVGLEVLGPVAVPALRQTLTDPSPRVRITATNLLAKLK